MTADTVKISGPLDKNEKIPRAVKIYILKEREKQRLEEEAETEKARKKKEQDEKKLKEETEMKVIKDKLTELTKKREQLQQDKTKVYDHLKKLVSEPNKHSFQIEDLTKLYNIGLHVTHVTTVTQPVHPITVPATIIPRSSTISVNPPYKVSNATAVPVQAIPAQKRNRSPSPTVYRSTYGYKQPTGPHAFQKLEDPHRNHEYNRSYLYKPGNPPQSGAYSAFYPAAQNVAYTHPSATVHSNAGVYSTYSNRENVDVMHKSQPQSAPPPPTQPQHSSLYTSHRSSIQNVPSSSIQQTNHVSYLVDHTKPGQPYPEDKYYMVRPSGHVPVHSIQQPPQGSKHGSITAGYPVRPVATQIGPQAQLHLQQSHGSHHGSQSSHHSSQSSHHSSQQSHHPSLSSHHSPQTHHTSSQQPQSHIQPSHHQQSSVHYSPSQSQLHHSQSQSSQQSHSSQQPPVSVQSHHPNPHHQHIQQLHVQSHHPQASSHHQLISHHSSPSIHHTSSQQHLQQAMHHQQAMQQSQSHHQSHSQQMHHPQMTQPHIQQHISSHQSQSQVQQSQPTSVVTSQGYVNQMNSIQGGNRVVYSQPNIPH